jgi:hypothetical protein
MISLKPIAPVSNVNNNLQRAYFLVPTSVGLSAALSTSQYAVFSMGGGRLKVNNSGVSVGQQEKSIIACGIGTELYLDSYSLNIGLIDAATNNGKGLGVDSTFNIFRNNTLQVSQVLPTSAGTAYQGSFAVNDLLYEYENLIYFTFTINSTPPSPLSKIYLNLILNFSYAI